MFRKQISTFGHRSTTHSVRSIEPCRAQGKIRLHRIALSLLPLTFQAIAGEPQSTAPASPAITAIEGVAALPRNVLRESDRPGWLERSSVPDGEWDSYELPAEQTALPPPVASMATLFWSAGIWNRLPEYGVARPLTIFKEEAAWIAVPPTSPAQDPCPAVAVSPPLLPETPSTAHESLSDVSYCNELADQVNASTAVATDLAKKTALLEDTESESTSEQETFTEGDKPASTLAAANESPIPAASENIEDSPPVKSRLASSAESEESLGEEPPLEMRLSDSHEISLEAEPDPLEATSSSSLPAEESTTFHLTDEVEKKSIPSLSKDRSEVAEKAISDQRSEGKIDFDVPMMFGDIGYSPSKPVESSKNSPAAKPADTEKPKAADATKSKPKESETQGQPRIASEKTAPSRSFWDFWRSRKDASTVR
jgi:hypothetical protein